MGDVDDAAMHCADLAGDALWAFRHGDDKAAFAQVQQILDAYGLAGLGVAIHFWADVALHAKGVPWPDEQGEGFVAEVALHWNAGDPDPGMRWAGQFLAARAAWDKDAAEALISVLRAALAEERYEDIDEMVSAMLAIASSAVNEMAGGA